VNITVLCGTVYSGRNLPIFRTKLTTSFVRVYDENNEGTSNMILRSGEYLKHLITKAVCSANT